MRHRIGIALAVAMLAELFFLGGWGYLRVLGMPSPGEQLTDLPAGGGSLTHDHRVLAGLAVLSATGLLAGILVATPWVSPLATGLPGVVLLGWTGFYLINVKQSVDLIPLRADSFGAGFEAMLLNGTLAAIGFALIVPMLVPSRWRGRTIADSVMSPAELPTAPVPAAVLEPIPATEPSELSSTGETPWTIAQRAATMQSDNPS